MEEQRANAIEVLTAFTHQLAEPRTKGGADGGRVASSPSLKMERIISLHPRYGEIGRRWDVSDNEASSF